MVKIYHALLTLALFMASASLMNSQVVINYSNAQACQDDIVDIDVRVDGFVDVLVFTIKTKWNPNHLQFMEVSNQHSSLPASDFVSVSPSPGTLRSIFSPLGVVDYNIPSNEILYTIRFRVITPSSLTSQVDTLGGLPPNDFFRNENGSTVPTRASSNPATVTLNGAGCGPGSAENTLLFEDVAAIQGNEICIPLIGKDLIDLGGFSGLEFNFDPTILSYNRFEEKTAPDGRSVINAINASSGLLRLQYSYVEPNGSGLTSDSTVILCLCFDVIGDCDEVSDLNMTRAGNFVIVNILNVELDHALLPAELTVSCCEATAMIDDVSCPGAADGSISLTPVGCTDITGYEWSNTNQTTSTITGLDGGFYDVTITYDGGATRVIPDFEVKEDSPMMISSKTLTKVVSGMDGAIDIEVSGGTSPYTYLWSNAAVTQDINGLAAADYSVTITDDKNCMENFPFTVATAPNIMGSTTSITCFGTATGAIDISVSGGATPYSYNWDCAGSVDITTGDITNVLAGNCNVTVTDANNCSTTAAFTVAGPTGPISIAPIVIDDASNDGNGEIDLNPSGGWGGFSFDWSDGSSTVYPNVNPLTGLFGGEYNVTITDQMNCRAEFGSFTVEGIRLSATSIDAIQCFGDNNGTINISVEGGSGTYTYDWSCAGNVDANGNITGLTGGDCIVTVTDIFQNIDLIDTFTVPGPDAAISPQIEETCATSSDGQLTAIVSGGLAPYSYSWTTTPTQNTATASGLDAGNYTLMITDSLGCQAMASATVTDCAMNDCFVAMDAITPNDDDLNEFFIIDCANNLNNTLRIFTRWGEEVIAYNNYQNEWNGRDEGGNLVDEDTYMWVLEVNSILGTSTIYKGAVSVIYELR